MKGLFVGLFCGELLNFVEKQKQPQMIIPYREGEIKRKLCGIFQRKKVPFVAISNVFNSAAVFQMKFFYFGLANTKFYPFEYTKTIIAKERMEFYLSSNS